MSLVLSFMVVWDLPRIGKGVKSLETSRLSAVYAEVAPSVSIFGELFGRALQAQVRHPLSILQERVVVHYMILHNLICFLPRPGVKADIPCLPTSCQE